MRFGRKWARGKNSKTLLSKTASVTLLGTLNAFDEAIKAASGGVYKPELGKIAAIGSQYETQRHLNALPSQHIHQLLEGAIDHLLRDRSGLAKRVVIFIDDLDRCTPEVGLKLLEGIKVYLNLNNCVILFGMDQRQIERALTKALGLTEGVSANQAREYLEKSVRTSTICRCRIRHVKPTILSSCWMR